MTDSSSSEFKQLETNSITNNAENPDDASVCSSMSSIEIIDHCSVLDDEHTDVDVQLNSSSAANIEDEIQSAMSEQTDDNLAEKISVISIGEKKVSVDQEVAGPVLERVRQFINFDKETGVVPSKPLIDHAQFISSVNSSPTSPTMSIPPVNLSELDKFFQQLKFDSLSKPTPDFPKCTTFAQTSQTSSENLVQQPKNENPICELSSNSTDPTPDARPARCLMVNFKKGEGFTWSYADSAQNTSSAPVPDTNQVSIEINNSTQNDSTPVESNNSNQDSCPSTNSASDVQQSPVTTKCKKSKKSKKRKSKRKPKEIPPNTIKSAPSTVIDTTPINTPAYATFSTDWDVKRAEQNRRNSSIYGKLPPSGQAAFENFEMAGRKLYAFLYSIERDSDKMADFQKELKRTETLIDMLDAKIGAALYGIKRLNVGKEMQKEQNRRDNGLNTSDEESDFESKFGKIDTSEFDREKAEAPQAEEPKSEKPSKSTSKKVTFKMPDAKKIKLSQPNQKPEEKAPESPIEDYVQMRMAVPCPNQNSSVVTMTVDFDLTKSGPKTSKNDSTDTDSSSDSSSDEDILCRVMNSDTKEPSSVKSNVPVNMKIKPLLNDGEVFYDAPQF